MFDWRKGMLCLMSVAAMGVQAAHVTVDVPRHTTAVWTSGLVTKDVTNDGFDVPNGTENVVVTFRPDYPCLELDRTECVIPGPVSGDVEFPSQDLPTATLREDGGLPMTDILQWGGWSARNKTRHAPHGSFIETPGQPMFDAYTQRLAENSDNVDAMWLSSCGELEVPKPPRQTPRRFWYNIRINFKE